MVPNSSKSLVTFDEQKYRDMFRWNSLSEQLSLIWVLFNHLKPRIYIIFKNIRIIRLILEIYWKPIKFNFLFKSAIIRSNQPIIPIPRGSVERYLVFNHVCRNNATFVGVQLMISNIVKHSEFVWVICGLHMKHIYVFEQYVRLHNEQGVTVQRALTSNVRMQAHSLDQMCAFCVYVCLSVPVSGSWLAAGQSRRKHSAQANSALTLRIHLAWLRIPHKFRRQTYVRHYDVFTDTFAASAANYCTHR